MELRVGMVHLVLCQLASDLAQFASDLAQLASDLAQSAFALGLVRIWFDDY